MNKKLELMRTSIPWPVELGSTRTLEEPTSHSDNSQRVLTRLIRPVCAQWYCCSLRYTRYPGSQYPCCCRYIISWRGYTRNENSNDTSPNRKLYHPCVRVYKIQILSTVVPGICYAGTRSYLVLGRTCVPGRLSTYSSMYRFSFDGRFDTPGAMPRCSVRSACCMVRMGRFAANSGALSMSLVRARWSI